MVVVVVVKRFKTLSHEFFFPLEPTVSKSSKASLISCLCSKSVHFSAKQIPKYFLRPKTVKNFKRTLLYLVAKSHSSSKHDSCTQIHCKRSESF